MRTGSLLTFALILISFLGCDTSSTLEDPNDSFFIKFYGGDGEQTGDDLALLPDGNFLLFGTTKPSGNEQTTQWYLVKAGPNGNVIWEKRFGNRNLNEEAKDIELTNDNRIVLVGNSAKGLNDRDIKIMTLSLDGVPLDSAIFGLNESGLETDENAGSVSLTSNGFIVSGSTTYTPVGATNVMDGLHVRFNNNLTIYPTWTQSSGQGAIDFAVKVVEMSSSKYYGFGYSNSATAGHPNADYNYWVFELGVTGVPSNNAYYGLTDDEKLSAISIAPPVPADGFFLGGVSVNALGAADIFVLKSKKQISFLPNDNQYQKSLSIRLGTNPANKVSTFATVQGDYFILANENSFNNNQNWILTKLNFDGSLAWSLPIVFGGEGIDTCGSVQELPDGRIVMIGTMRTGKPDAGEFKMTLIKVNPDGKLTN